MKPMILTALLTAATALPMSALAIGGDDPIPGIDIIMKENPGSQPIMPFTLSGEAMARINDVKGVDRPEIILRETAKRIGADEGFVKSGMAVMVPKWCGKCELPETQIYTFRYGKPVYTLTLKLSERDDNVSGRELKEERQKRRK